MFEPLDPAMPEARDILLDFPFREPVYSLKHASLNWLSVFCNQIECTVGWGTLHRGNCIRQGPTARKSVLKPRISKETSTCRAPAVRLSTGQLVLGPEAGAGPLLVMALGGRGLRHANTCSK